MSKYLEDVDKLKEMKCLTCGGLGKCDDLEPGDITCNKWTCETCVGTGYAKETGLFIVYRCGTYAVGNVWMSNTKEPKSGEELKELSKLVCEIHNSNHRVQSTIEVRDIVIINWKVIENES